MAKVSSETVAYLMCFLNFLLYKTTLLTTNSNVSEKKYDMEDSGNESPNMDDSCVESNSKMMNDRNKPSSECRG